MKRSTKSTIRIGRFGAGALFLILLAGCTVGPNYKRPQVPVAPAFRGADNAQVATTDKASLGDENWVEVFREPELQDLIRTALTNNYDVRIAAQRVLEQQAQVRITHSQEFPTLSVGGSGIGAELPDSLSNTIGSSIYAGSFNLSAAWTPDFWGLYRRQTESARAQMLAQVWAQRAVRMALVEQVASSYIQLRALDRQLAIAKQTLAVRQQSVDLTRRLADGGSAPLSDLREAEELQYTASSQIPQLEQQIQQQENALRLLLGENPGPIAHTNDSALAPPPQNLPVGLPSRLLERRPDILEAEQQLIAANAQIGVARAQFFPQLSISASGGVGGDQWSNLFDPAGHTIYGIGTLTQPLFEGGKLRGQLQLS
ncbi:MAG: efflux transporter outer membrane subunit, partial [Acidobacteriaceae bacterium]